MCRTLGCVQRCLAPPLARRCPGLAALRSPFKNDDTHLKRLLSVSVKFTCLMSLEAIFKGAMTVKVTQKYGWSGGVVVLDAE